MTTLSSIKRVATARLKRNVCDLCNRCMAESLEEV